MRNILQSFATIYDMKKILVLLFFIAAMHSQSFAQYIFDIKGKDLEYVQGYEKAAKSVSVKPASQYLDVPGIGQPLIFRRTEKLLPDLLVYYFPNTKDSTINYVLYEWDESNFTKDRQAVKQPLEKLKPYIDKYTALKQQAVAFFGEPETSGSMNDLTLIEAGKFRQKDYFVKNGVSLEMYIALSNKQETNGIVSILPTHRIRMYIRTEPADR